MANNFATLKNAASSEKFNLIRIEPARAVEGDLVLSSGTTYTATFAFPVISRIKVNGTLYTLVSGTPTSGQYSFSESTRSLTINLGAALSTQVIAVYYYLFFSKDKNRITFEDPLDSGTLARQWTPRIAADPNFNFNLKDITEGYLTFGVSSIELFNEDGFFEQYLTDNDSFSNKRITIWLCLNSVENVKLVFRGIINKLSKSRRVSIEYFDEFSVLNKTFFSNGTFLESSYNTTQFANLHPAKENLPIYRLFAEVTRYRVVDDGLATGLHRMDLDRLLEAHCVSFSTVISTTTNREWGTILSEGDGGVQNDTVQTIDQTDPNYTVLGYGSGKKYRIGDLLQINTTIYVRVYYVDTGADEIWVTKDGTLATSQAIVRPGVSVMLRQDNVDYYPLYIRDYTLDYAGQTNDIIKITFVNNFEANISLPNPLNPDSDVVKFRAWADTAKDLLHGTVVKTILEESGLTVNAASITAANATTLYANFYIPQIDEGNFKPYSANLENLLYSTVGYLSINNDLEFTYSLFAAPGSTNATTDREILFDSFNVNIDYNDIRNTVIPENSHDIIELGYTNPSQTSAKATYLHEIEKQVTYKHLLSTLGRLTAFKNLISERKAYFKFSTKVNPDVLVGDDFEIERSKILGDDTTRNIKIMSISKQATKVDLSGYDFLGL